ncbi:Golgi SNAP receptor complex member 2-like [Rhopilema esculentum]|uniref:Golgi SNAP receptor complex member 2-like n=1 Tax=Rhopilema esculentum TaxID=499914 RepID=UPI0031D2BDF4
METLTQQTNRLVLQVQAQLNQLGRETGEDLLALENNVDLTLKDIFANTEALDAKLIKEPAHRRQSSKLKVDQIKYDVRHLDTAFKTYLRKKRMKEEQEKAREDLLSTTFTTNAQSGDTSIMIDHSLQHHTRLGGANRNMDEMLDNGSNILANLRDQRMSLKGIQKRIFDIGSTLGLSNTVMRLIEKRGTQDKWILYGGMLITFFIMYLAFSYLR